MHQAIDAYNNYQSKEEAEICNLLARSISKHFPEAKVKIWHKHPVWFLDENPIVGYSKLKAGIRLMFWSGASFEEENLNPGSGKFKDASVLYTSVNQVSLDELDRWISKSKDIQWDYKNIYKRKGKLERIRPKESGLGI